MCIHMDLIFHTPCEFMLNLFTAEIYKSGAMFSELSFRCRQYGSIFIHFYTASSRWRQGSSNWYQSKACMPISLLL